MRKHYLDNIRWITIVLVVLFHCFFYFNNIGVEKPIFSGLETYDSTAGVTFAGIFQYAVYPWFMELLFVVAGMSSYYALQTRTTSQYRKERVRKLLVPSTLGVLCFGWISGEMLNRNIGVEALDQMPLFGKYIINTLTGIGALWFCQALFVISMLLLLIRKLEQKIDPQAKFRTLCARTGLVGILLLFIPILAASQIGNVPIITAYRMGVYTMAFLLGYYIFSNESVEEICRKYAWLFLTMALISGIYYIYRAYGTYYADGTLLKTWYSSLFGYLMTPACLGIAGRYINKRNRFTDVANRYSFKIYIVHITVMVVAGYFTKNLTLPITARYLILAVAGFAGTPLLVLILEKIPGVRYVLFGTR